MAEPYAGSTARRALMSTTRSSTFQPRQRNVHAPNSAVPMISISFIDCQSVPTGETASTIWVSMVPALACPEISAAYPRCYPPPHRQDRVLGSRK